MDGGHVRKMTFPMQIRYTCIFTQSITPRLMKPTFVKLCAKKRDVISDKHVHTKQALLCEGWGEAAYILAAGSPTQAGVRLHLLKKQSVGCKFFAGFKESLRAPGPR